MKMSERYTVKLVERSEVRDFIELHHYSHNVNGLKSDYCFAMYEGQEIIGAMMYGTMAMANQWKKYALSESSREKDVLELRRLVLIDDTERNAESFFIAKTLKWLRMNTTVEIIVSYADPNYGHEGVVYKASNFTHVGMTSPGKVIVFNGKKYHDKAIRAKYKGKLKPFAVALRNALNSGDAYYVNQEPKHIYIYYLQNPGLNANTHEMQKGAHHL